LILISGSTGFLGAHMACRLLLQNKRLRLIKRNTSNLKEFNSIFDYYFASKSLAEVQEVKQLFSWVEADILNIAELEAAFSEVKEVYHCAAMVSFAQKDKPLMDQINITGTANMVNLALLHKIEKFCFVSSIASIGRSLNNQQIDENCKWEKSPLNSNYAISKYKAEMEVWRAKEEGLNVCIINPGVILGYGDFTKGSIALFNTVFKGVPFYTTGINGYVDVQDVCLAATTLMNKNIFGKRYILISENVSIQHLFNLIAKYLRVKPPRIKITPFLGEIAWRVFAVVRFFKLSNFSLTKETARASQKKFHYTNSKICAEISFTFKPIEQTVQEVCEKFLIQKG
jgi:nucleoside-diphosphate-sugar epimerase